MNDITCAVAHELMHRRNRFDRFLAEALMTLFEDYLGRERKRACNSRGVRGGLWSDGGHSGHCMRRRANNSVAG